MQRRVLSDADACSKLRKPAALGWQSSDCAPPSASPQPPPLGLTQLKAREPTSRTMKSLLATILSVPCVAANAGYVGPYTSFAGDKKCTSVPASSHAEGIATNYALDYSCDSLQV